MKIKNLYRFLFLALLLVNSVLRAQTITLFAGTGAASFSGDGGQASAASLYHPAGMAMDAAGNLYVADQANNRVRKISTAGVITTVAGNGTAGSSGNGGAATAAMLNNPAGVAVDGSGNLYIADYNNAQIRKVNTSGVISNYCGTGTIGYGGEGAAATGAAIARPTGVAADAAGNVYFAEQSNMRVRIITTAGILRTYAGNGAASFTGDGGQASAASISYPAGVGVDAGGNVYIADAGNNRIRKITTAGIISTIAGNGGAGYSGDGAAATAAALNNPAYVAADVAGNIYVCDLNNQRLRKIAAGVINTIAGTGTSGSSGNGGAATAAQIYNPSGVYITAAGVIYLADNGNNAIRKIGAATNSAPAFTAGTVQNLGLCTSASASAINTPMAITDADAGQTETWSVALAPVHGTLSGFPRTATSTGGTLTPASLTYTPTVGYTGSDSFKIQISDGTLTGLTTVRVIMTAAPTAGTITGATSVCTGANITLSNTTSGGVWTLANTAIASISAGGVVTGIAAGNTVISYAVTNSCGTVYATKADTVKALATAGTITGPTRQCTGSNITLSDAITGGTWSTSNTSLATTTAAGVIRGVAAGTVTISYGVTNSCGTVYATKLDTVAATAVAGTITGTGSVCVSAVTTLGNTTTGGVWTCSNAAIATINSSGVVTGVAAGSAAITYTVTNVCSSATTTLALTVNAVPNAGTITGATRQCTGSNITLTDAVSGGTWSTSNTSIATTTAAGVIRGVTAGTVTISYGVTNSCGTVYATRLDTVLAASSAGTIAGTSTLCVGGSVTLTDGIAGGTWSSSNTSVLTISSSGVATGVTAGSATITYTVSICGSATTTISMTVNSGATAGTITGTTSVSAGSTTALADAVSGGTWTSANAAIATVNSSGVVTGVSAGSVVISYSVTNSCGTAVATASVTVTSTYGSAPVINHFAGVHHSGFSGDGGQASAAALSGPAGFAFDASGNMYVADLGNNRIRKITTAGVITTIGGNGTAGVTGDGGAATAATLSSPQSVAVDAAGNVYIADYDNAEIRKISTSGIMTRVAGYLYPSLSADGTAATAAYIQKPTCVAVDGAGAVYMCEQNNHLIRKISTSGYISTVAGNSTPGFSGDGGAATAATLSYPSGMMVDATGNVYVLDAGNNRVRKVSVSGIITTIAGTGGAGYSGDGGQATAALLNNPTGIAMDASGNLLIVDHNNHRLRQISPAGIITTIAGTGVDGFSGNGGPATAARFYNPQWVAMSAGNTYVTDMGNSDVRIIASVSHAPSFTAGASQSILGCSTAGAAFINSILTITDIDAGQTETWSVTSSPAHGTLGGFNATATSNGSAVSPTGLTYTPATGYTGADSFVIRVSDGTNSATTLVRVAVSPATTAGTISGASSVCADTWNNYTSTVSGGTWSVSDLYIATISTSGSMYLMNSGAVTITYTVVNSCGTAVATKAATSSYPPSLDNITGLATVAVGSTITLAETITGGTWSSSNTAFATVSSTGLVRGLSNGGVTITYTASNYCGTVYTTKYVAVGVVVTNPIIFTYAGNGYTGYQADGYWPDGAAIAAPSAIAKDKFGNIYIVEQPNQQIRKVDKQTGYMRTIAGGLSTAGFWGDGGQATAALLNNPAGIAVDKNGNVYIADFDNFRIRKINTSGIISTIAGTGTIGFTADGGSAVSAAIARPTAVTVDTNGNVYFAEQNNHRIRKISTAGILTTLAGNGTASFSGDGGAATAAALSYPVGIWASPTGLFYIADAGNNRIRKVTAAGVISTVAGTGAATYTGDGGAATAATLHNPYGTTTDSIGNVYIADRDNNVVRKITLATGIITTVAGNGTAGYGGDHTPATTAWLYHPVSVVCDSVELYIADFSNNVVRVVGNVIYNNSTPSFINYYGYLALCRNSSAVGLDTFLTIHDWDYNQTERWYVTRAAAHGTLTGFPYSTLSNGDNVTPTGLFYTPITGYTGVDTFYVNVNDGHDSISSVYFYVNVTAAATVAAITGASSLVISTPITLADATSGGVWSSTNTSRATVSGSGRVTGVTAGADTIKYTVTNACGSVAALKPITIAAGRGVNPEPGGAEAELTEVRIYPNPTNGLITIDIPANTGITTVYVTDINGKLVRQVTTEDSKVTVDLGQLAHGTYLVKTINSKGVFTGKVVLWE